MYKKELHTNRYYAKLELMETFSKVLFHDKVIDEVMNLVIGKGIEEQFINAFHKNIELIERLGVNVVQLKNFEKLKGVDGLYSMKFKGKNMNLRMLYSYDVSSETIMLHFFYERDDSKKDRYVDHIPIAVARKKEMECYGK